MACIELEHWQTNDPRCFNFMAPPFQPPSNRCLELVVWDLNPWLLNKVHGKPVRFTTKSPGSKPPNQRGKLTFGTSTTARRTISSRRREISQDKEPLISGRIIVRQGASNPRLNMAKQRPTHLHAWVVHVLFASLRPGHVENVRTDSTNPERSMSRYVKSPSWLCSFARGFLLVSMALPPPPPTQPQPFHLNPPRTPPPPPPQTNPPALSAQSGVRAVRDGAPQRPRVPGCRGLAQLLQRLLHLTRGPGDPWTRGTGDAHGIPRDAMPRALSFSLRDFVLHPLNTPTGY